MIYLGGKYCAVLILSLICRTTCYWSVQLDPKGQQHTSAKSPGVHLVMRCSASLQRNRSHFISHIFTHTFTGLIWWHLLLWFCVYISFCCFICDLRNWMLLVCLLPIATFILPVCSAYTWRHQKTFMLPPVFIKQYSYFLIYSCLFI